MSMFPRHCDECDRLRERVAAADELIVLLNTLVAVQGSNIAEWKARAEAAEATLLQQRTGQKQAADGGSAAYWKDREQSLDKDSADYSAKTEHP